MNVTAAGVGIAASLVVGNAVATHLVNESGAGADPTSPATFATRSAPILLLLGGVGTAAIGAATNGPGVAIGGLVAAGVGASMTLGMLFGTVTSGDSNLMGPPGDTG